jgi:hypothetical protein
MTYSEFVSPHNFDGSGPVPKKVQDAAKQIANLRVRFLTSKTEPSLTTNEIEALFSYTAIQAEWMRELIEYRDILSDNQHKK